MKGMGTWRGKGWSVCASKLSIFVHLFILQLTRKVITLILNCMLNYLIMSLCSVMHMSLLQAS